MTETHSSVLPRRRNIISPRRRSSTWIPTSLEVSSAAPVNGKSAPLPRPNASALDAPLMNPLRDMSISFCSPPKGSKSQEFEEFKHSTPATRYRHLLLTPGFWLLAPLLEHSSLRIKEIKPSFRVFLFDQTARFVCQKEF